MKVIVIGPRGKMGKLITQVAASRDDMKLVAGIAPKGRDYVGMDLGTVAMTGSELGVPVTDDLAGVIDSCDVIIDFSTKENLEVDSKLLKMAEKLDAYVVTNDFNLNKVAEFQGVKVLNINELSNAIKPVVLPGEEMTVTVIKNGKEQGQGVAYLNDGTMIVVEGGNRYIGETIGVVVTSVLQTAAGSMIFARKKDCFKH